MFIYNNVWTNLLCLQTKMSIFWKQRMEICEVQFSNRSFIAQQFINLKEHQAKSDCKQLQGTQKIGCQAHITARLITPYPDFTLSEVAALSVQKTKKEELLAQLHMPPPPSVGRALRALC